MMRSAWLAWCLIAWPVQSADWDYHLDPVEVAPGTYVFFGASADFDAMNGGNIANTAFVVTDAGVVVIDTGPSRRFGEQMRHAIAGVTGKPVVKVFNTHLHPDHVFGNQAFADVGVEALPGTILGMAGEGEGFLDNLYRLVAGWMSGTVVHSPGREAVPGEMTIGAHRFRLLALKGHSGADLALFDLTTGVLFAGDLVFNRRAPTTPHAHIPSWLEALDLLEALPFRVLVPGHGPVAGDAEPIRHTRDYLIWMERALEQAAEDGRDMAEAMVLPIPAQFHDLALLRREFGRSVSHLYMNLELRALGRAGMRRE